MKKGREIKQVILFANTLWFLRNFKQNLLSELSKNYKVKCYYLRIGFLDNDSVINLEKKYPIEFIRFNFFYFFKELFCSLLCLINLYNIKILRHRIIVFTISPTIISSIIFFSNSFSIIYVLEGLGRLFSSRRVVARILRRLLEIIYRIIFSYAQNIVVLNPTDAVYLSERQIAPMRKIYILPGTGLNTNKYSIDQFEQNKNEKYIDFIGRIIPDKGFYEFIYSREVLIRQYPDIAKKYTYRVIAPKSQLENLNSRDISFFKDKGIIFCPYLDNTYKYYINTHILVHPTKYAEGLSMVILEASYLGIKVLTTKNRGTEQILDPNYKYFLNNTSCVHIADYISKISLDDDYFNNIKSQQSKRVMQLFNVETSTKSFMNLIM